MHRDQRIPLRRSQIYAVLNGDLVQVPPWEFVRAFVLACRQFAERNQRWLLTSTDLAI
jgi:hypothetical protein